MPSERPAKMRSHRGDTTYAPGYAFPSRSAEEIAGEVDERLVRDERLDARQVNVAVEDGVITLSGEVDTLQAKRAAGEDARGAVGAIDVRNMLRVRSEHAGPAGPQLTQDALTSTEEGSMAYDRRGSAGMSRYYYGYYGPYWAATTRSDTEIAEDVRNRLVWDSWVDADQIDIRLERRVVTLDGELDSIVEKRSAGDDACDTPGVLDVVNNLRVRQSRLER